jgi:acyl-ACP thioesterase
MDGYGAFWMLARMWYELERPLTYGRELCIHTWHRGGRGASSYRDFDLYADGTYIGQAVSVWALVHMEDRRMLRISDVPGLMNDHGGERSKTITLTRLRMPEQFTCAERRLMHYSDTDINAHVNNNRYADFACDALQAHTMPHTFVRQMQLGYTAECRPGEVIDMLHAAPAAKQVEWIPVTERLPEEHDSFFARFYGTERWMPAMFRKVSDEVIVCIKYEDGSASVKTAKTHDWEWDISSIWRAEVTHWMPLPQPPEEVK